MHRCCCQMSCIQGPLRFGVLVTDNLTFRVNNLAHTHTISSKVSQEEHDVQKLHNIIQTHKVGNKQFGMHRGGLKNPVISQNPWYSMAFLAFYTEVSFQSPWPVTEMGDGRWMAGGVCPFKVKLS